jgi:predicted ArsR family transcriptional regulator
MQQTRQQILEILRKRQVATVDEIAADLRMSRGDITPVTIRHHLGILQEDGLVESPEIRRRRSPGRPQIIYALTDKARAAFPNNYQQLVTALLTQLRETLPPQGVNVILEGVATQWAANAQILALTPSERMDAVVEYLNSMGYEASWHASSEGIVLTTTNCPYHQVAAVDASLCEMDMRLIASLMGSVARRQSHVLSGDHECSYVFPFEETATQIE